MTLQLNAQPYFIRSSNSTLGKRGMYRLRHIMCHDHVSPHMLCTISPVLRLSRTWRHALTHSDGALIMGARWLAHHCAHTSVWYCCEICGSEGNTAMMSPSMLGYNKVCEYEDFADPGLAETIRDVFRHEVKYFTPEFPKGAEYRKYWEIGMSVRALRTFGALRPDAVMLGVGAGTEATVFYLTNH